MGMCLSRHMPFVMKRFGFYIRFFVTVRVLNSYDFSIFFQNRILDFGTYYYHKIKSMVKENDRMKKTKGILTGTLLVMALGMLTACGSNNNKADESGTVTEDKKEDNAKTDNTETDTRNDGENGSNADTNSGADDTAMDNGDTVSEETEENSGTVTDDNSESQENNIDNTKDKKNNDGTVSGALGDGVKDLGDGVGDAVEDVGDAVENAVDGR